MHSKLRFLPDIVLKHRPIHLTLFVSRKCNARCPFCFYVNNRQSEDTPELSLDEIERLSNSLGDLLWLSLSGGEVFLRDDIVGICEAFYRNNRPSIILLSTNGLLPERIREGTERILRACPDSTVAVKLSLDGLGQRHDELRGLPGSFEKFNETYEGLKNLSGRFKNFELGVNTVFCASNQDRMDEIMDFVSGLQGVRTHTISMVRGEMEDASQKNVSLQRYQNAIERLARDLRRGTAPRYGFWGAKIKAAQDVLQRRLIHRTLSTQQRQLPCYAGRLNLVVTETGDVYPCEVFTGEMRLGNLRNFQFELADLLKSLRAEKIISTIGKECFCTHECFMMTNILFNPRTYPALLKEYARLA